MSTAGSTTRRRLLLLLVTVLAAIGGTLSVPTAAWAAEYKVVKIKDYGVLNTPYTKIAEVSSAGGQQTLRIDVTRSVAKKASLTGGLSIQAISAQLGFERTGTSTITVSCSTTVERNRSAVYTAYPRSQVVEYYLYKKVGSAWESQGRGQFYEPVGFHCQLKYL